MLKVSKHVNTGDVIYIREEQNKGGRTTVKARKTRRALLASGLSLLASVALLAGTTFAWFTDSVVSSSNIIRAGNLDVTMEWADGTEEPEAAAWKDASEGAIFDYDLWEPGYTEVRHVRIRNTGSLALKYQIQIVATGEVSELADVIDVYYIKGGQQIASRTDLDGLEPIGTLSDVLAEPYAASGHLLTGDTDSTDVATIALKMQESAGNAYQGLSIGSEFAVQLTATQYTYETDGFGSNQYDKDASVTGASVMGIAGFEGVVFDTVQDAYNAISPVVDALAGLGQDVPSKEEFDALFTDNGVITWVIYGEQTVDNNLLFSFGRKSSYYGERNITSIRVIGGNETAKLVMNTSIRNPYNWWGPEVPTTSLHFSNLTLEQGENLAQLSFTDGLYGYTYEFSLENCVINGKIYFYWNQDLDMTVDGCTFHNTLGDDGSYALFVQGDQTGTVRFTNNVVDGYTRGVNFQRNQTEFLIDGNIFRNNSEVDRAALQLTTASKFTVTNNTFEESIASNAIWLWDGFNNPETLIADNDIRSAYSVSGYKTEYTNVTATGNRVTPTQCWEKDADAPSDCLLDLT